ncbi:Dipeptidyl aminopeptidase/acylaminoacyl peptidase [Flavobacteriaceae bacterium MAR_2010_188]|nr:Dipeptidyl aminopeptidase/acylaminoacyl peptidase [Flavobacteriaceae bacterium MAR_2010_188]
MTKKFAFLLLLSGFFGFAQVNLEYQDPPASILELVNAPLVPSVQIDSKGENVILLYRDAYKSISELSEEELRLAGLRINPKTNIGSRTRFYNNLMMKKTSDKDAKQVTGLPANARLSDFSWSPDESKIAFLNTVDNGVEVWLMDVKNSSTKKLTDPIVNANTGDAIAWFKDNQNLLVKTLPANRKELIDVASAIPTGPTISISDGSKAQNRTYQDLLQNPNDEFNFEQLSYSTLKKVSVDGSVTDFMGSNLYLDVDFSPNGEYLMVSHMKKPFSYLVTYDRFPHETNIYKSNGELVQKINDVALDEVRPKGFMSTREGKRSMNWRNDKPATIYWAEALDKGDPEIEVAQRDAVYQLSAPFNGPPELLFKTINRYSGVSWGNDNTAIVSDYWWNTRNTKTYIFDPSNPKKDLKMISDRNYQDVYNDPGNFVTTKNKMGEYVLEMDGKNLFLMGDGYSEEGQFPFIDKLNTNNLKTERIYKSAYTDKLENLISAIDMEEGKILVRIESQNEYPNYYIRDIEKKEDLSPITAFENPFKSIQEVDKKVITYKRDDGLDLDATLYLPLDYEEGKKYPMVMWAYPREFKDKNSASQNTTNPNEFIYPYYGSPIYWVTRGYVVLDDAAFPIVGEGEVEPNDSFRKQLVANAKAAIDAVDEMGYIDRKKVAVGGHSYGAFMTANLLSHSDLFAAGIARSGAYNRTLTPFGFQSEERSYWEAPEVYNSMSPFMNADKMKTPLLLIHGVADNNSGTYPLQSERYFNALKGLGATVRLVMLPKESHGYAAKESILHLLWEQDQWLEKYVKNREDEQEGTD